MTWVWLRAKGREEAVTRQQERETISKDVDWEILSPLPLFPSTWKEENISI